ncbi:hypothetical protein ACTHAM_002454 [Cellulomonas soli]|uniref:hypothetical protein n=1 Tax=Cellulomonas soli TaxID=931535 RepID=UPI003F848081
MVLRPRWEWRLEDGGGQPVLRPVSPVFTNQFDAEQWLGEQWRVLASQGVRTATLLHEGAQVGPVLSMPAP